MSNIEKIKAEIKRRMKTILGVEGLVTGVADNMRYQGYKSLLAFIDSLPEEDPLNDPRFGEGFDAGRAVQRIFDESEEKPSEELEDAARYSEILTYPMPDDGDIEKVMKVQEARVFHEIGFKAGAEWQKVREGMLVSEDTISNKEIDKWVENHIVVPPDDELSEARRLVYADIVPSIIQWGKIIAHKFYDLGKKHNQLNKL